MTFITRDDFETALGKPLAAFNVARVVGEAEAAEETEVGAETGAEAGAQAGAQADA